jgi:hypothetical protein
MRTWRAVAALGLIVGLGLGWGARVPRAAAGEDRPGLTGRWEGTVLFATGEQARAEADLAADGDGWSGTWTLTVLDEEGPGQPQPGQVRFARAAAGFEARVPGPGAGETRFAGRVVPAGVHAEAALVGTFQGAREGVALLWRYRR